MDLSDIQKPFAKKMDNLAMIWDGSEKEVGQGYWLSSVIAADVDGEELIPLYGELYSQKAKDFESENEQILKAIRTTAEQLKGKGIWAIDRGGDRRKLVEKLWEMKAKFVIRARGDRKVKTSRGKMVKVCEIAGRIKTSVSYKISIEKEGYKEEKEIWLGTRHNLKVEEVTVSIVVIRGFVKKPMILMTNVDKNPKEILDIYLTRWKCEESFRFLKQEYHLEDVRVRSYISLRNTTAIMQAVFYFVSVYLQRGLRVNILLKKILEKAKRFFEVPVFKHYAVADGIHRLLFNKKWEAENVAQKRKDKRQFMFEFA
jgi:hypothetical protein